MRRIAGKTAADAVEESKDHPMPRRRDQGGGPSDAQPSDGKLVAAVRAGDVESFELLVRRHRRKLLSTAFTRLGNITQAEDAVQETFLSAFRSMSTYDSRWSFRSWLWSILINQCRNEYRKTKRRNATTIDHEESEKEIPPERRLIRNEQLQVVSELMKRLPPPQAEAIQLRFFGEMKYEEIANTMQCGLTTAKNRVRVGLEKLSRWMQSSPSDANDD